MKPEVLGDYVELTKIDCLIEWCLTPFSTILLLYRRGQCTYPCFPGGLLTSAPHKFLSKPLAAFPHNHCRNKRQRWEGNESCRNDYHQSSERILTEPGIEPATFCSQVRKATDWAIGLGELTKKMKVYLLRRMSVGLSNTNTMSRVSTSLRFDLGVER